MVWFMGYPVPRKEVDSMILKGSFQISVFCDSMILSTQCFTEMLRVDPWRNVFWLLQSSFNDVSVLLKLWIKLFILVLTLAIYPMKNYSSASEQYVLVY